MKIENLTVGTTYKNWKALCEVLEVEPKPSGNSRDAQAKDFKQYFNWEKQGQKITVTEIYNTVQEREPGRGKSEASKQALEQHRGHRQPDFTYDDELQLAILLYLSNRTYYENEERQHRPNVKYPYVVGMSQLFTQTGLCSDFYKDVLNPYGYYLIGSKEQVSKGQAMFTKIQYEEAFRDFYKHMQNDVRTALNDLRRRKVLEYVEIKSWYDGQEWHPCNDVEMSLIVEAREDTIDWWNATHEKQLKETYDLYNNWTLTPKEKDEAFTYMNNRLKETISEDYVTYTSSFKVYCSQRAIERQLTKIGCNDLTRKEREAIIAKVSEKNMELQLKRTLDKQRSQQLETFYKWAEQEESVKHFGKKKDVPYMPLADDENYLKAKELLEHGVLGVDEEKKEKYTEMINKRKQQKESK